MKKILILALMLTLSSSTNLSQVNARTLYQTDSKTAESAVQFTQVKASHILVDTKEQAQKIREEILAGKSFEDMAEKYSKCPSGAKGGDLGYFEKGMMVPEFEKAAFNLPVDQVSEPVKTEFGWHLIVVTAKR